MLKITNNNFTIKIKRMLLTIYHDWLGDNKELSQISPFWINQISLHLQFLIFHTNAGQFFGCMYFFIHRASVYAVVNRPVWREQY